MLEQDELVEGSGEEEVKRYIVIFYILIQLSGTVTAVAAEGQARLYAFYHNDVGTVANYIILDGVERGITFHESSDKKALKAFNCLNPSIFLPNSDRENRKIILEGKLHPDVYKTSEAQNRLQPEEYQYFTLYKWFILVPFAENTYYSEDHLPDQQPDLLTRVSLKKGDFKCEIEIDLDEILMNKEELSRKIAR